MMSGAFISAEPGTFRLSRRSSACVNDEALNWSLAVLGDTFIYSSYVVSSPR
jgi:hypothetical protein